MPSTPPTPPTPPSRVSTSDLFDAHSSQAQVCDLQMRQFGAVRAFAGTMVTVRCYEDNTLLRNLLDEPGAGKVIVVDGGGSLHTSLLGDNLARWAIDAGWQGLVINGAVRDSQALAGMHIGVKALGTNPRKSAKTGAGDREATVSFGGANFTPGAFLASDDDGIIVLATSPGS